MKTIELTKDAVIIQNEQIRLELSHTGRLLHARALPDGTDRLKKGTAPSFCRLVFGNREVLPNSCKCVGNELTFWFEQGKRVVFDAVSKPEYLSFEIVRTEGITGGSIRFAEAEYDYPTPEFEDSRDSFGIVGVIMRANTGTAYYPDYMERKTGAEAFEEIGFLGAKYAVVAGKVGDHPAYLRAVGNDIEKGALPVSVGVGGPWAKQCDRERGSYIITAAPSLDSLREDMPLYRMTGIDIVDFHQGGLYRQGDFDFMGVPGGTAADFRREVTEYLEENGIGAGLHTYSALIDRNAAGLLSVPKWQKQLSVTERYTLRNAVSAEDTVLTTEETTDYASRDASFMALSSERFLIDTEIVSFSVTRIGDRCFCDVERGCAGTEKAEHRAGTEIRRIGSMYGCLCPVPGSELFYEVARRTAVTYNDGGFSMIYFDGLEGMIPHIGNPALACVYENLFINEVLRYTIKPPIAESSHFAPPAYFSRGRAGAWDSPKRAIKQIVRQHLAANETYRRIHLNATLGWLDIYPAAPEGYPKNAMYRYVFPEDIDDIGSQALAYDYSYVFQCLEKRLDTTPALRRNLERYMRYDKLRRERYFPEEVCRQIRLGKCEYALAEKEDGSFTFAEKKYSYAKTVPDDTVLGVSEHTNPFDGQEPFLRIEAYASADGGDPLVVLPMPADKELSELPQTVVFENGGIGTERRNAVRFSVFGNGNPEEAVAVRIYTKTPLCDDFGSVCDYVVRMNFTGWHEFYFADVDNCDYPAYFPEYSLLNARNVLPGDSVTKIEFLRSGECRGVQMTDITLCREAPAVLENPSVTVGNNTIRFLCGIRDGEYLAYTPGNSARIYDSLGNEREVDGIEGTLPVPSGSFAAVLSQDGNRNPAQRCRLTFGFTGKLLPITSQNS